MATRGWGALRVAVVAVGGLGWSGALGCDKPREKAAVVDASVGVSAGVSAGVREGVDSGAGARATASAGAGMPLCKVMSSEGGPSATADATRWLDVPAKAHFTVRTLATGRELRFEGPGRVRACGGDVALVAEGAAVGLPGTGEAPGAEQWAATACGVARWASGVHRFGSTRTACKLQTSVGTARLWLADDVQVEDVPLDAGASRASTGAGPADSGRAALPWRRIDAKRALRLHARGALDSAGAVKSALSSCEKAAQSVQSLASRMSAADAGSGSLGELAAESVVARGVARAACAVAAVRVSLAGSTAADVARLDEADSRWRAPRAATSKGD